MKKQITAALLALFLTSYAVASQTEQQDTDKAQTNVTNVTLSPEQLAISKMSSDELDKAISDFGAAKYTELYADLKKLESEFVRNHNQQTKDELLGFLKKHNLFAEIQKPVPQEMRIKSTEPGVMYSNYYPGVETDYEKIEAYYDKIVNGTNDFFVVSCSITFDK